ncbi:MAG TPA: mitochondrial fission ELM1 family protein [Roseiarcus sp.]|nr:mitochondrial fission ELM1 family protein [Roseiarcus sp.]
MGRALVGDGVRVLVLSSGRAGHEANCLGVAEALGAPYDKRIAEPRRLFASLSPFGPLDPKDRPGRPGSIIAEPFPSVAIACGRVTVPYLRALKRFAGRKVFAVFLQDPRYARSEFDLIWTPEHDRLSGTNVISTLTSPHPFSSARLAALSAAPDPRIASLPRPRAAILLGGASAAYDFAKADLSRLTEAVAAVVRQGFSVMATPSRRTSAAIIEAARKGLAEADPARVFFWEGSGDNPYGQILANADAILVTADSVNMMGEAVATGAPVHIFDLSGEAGRAKAFVAALVGKGVARRFVDRLESFAYEPIDSSATIAEAIASRFNELRP